MTIADPDNAVTEFVLMMERVQEMIITRRNPHEVIALLRDARRLLDHAEASLRDANSLDRSRLRAALPHLHSKLVELEQVAKLAD